MNLSRQEISKLIKYSDEYRNNCERHIRRVRRNMNYLVKRYDSLGEDFCKEDGIPHPDQEISMLKESKAEAVIIKKKLILLRDKGE